MRDLVPPSFFTGCSWKHVGFSAYCPLTLLAYPVFAAPWLKMEFQLELRYISRFSFPFLFWLPHPKCYLFSTFVVSSGTAQRKNILFDSKIPFFQYLPDNMTACSLLPSWLWISSQIWQKKKTLERWTHWLVRAGWKVNELSCVLPSHWSTLTNRKQTSGIG